MKPSTRDHLLALAAATHCAAIVVADSRSEHAQQVIEECLAQDGGAGVQAAVMIDGELIWSGVAGVADAEWNIPMSPDVRMRIGSVSKPFAAVIAARLIKDGALQPDAPIGDVLTQIPDDKQTITLRQLALHTSGIRHYDFSNYLEANNVFVRQNLMEALEPLLADDLVHEPGTAVTYTSIGYNVIGALCESASGRPFGALLATEIAAPLGLSNTLIDHPLAITPRRAGFYTVFPDGSLMNTVWRDSSDGYPSLGVLTTAQDMARFAHEVFAGELLGETVTALSTMRGTLAGGAPIGRTFGWEIGFDDDGAVRWYGHNGETNGGMAVLRYFPESKMSVAAIANYNVFPGMEPVFYKAAARDLPLLFDNQDGQ